MSLAKPSLHVGAAPLQLDAQLPTGQFVQLLGETYYQIAHYDQMSPFFMSLVSSADHWLFIGSTGGLTAGRRNAESALFPYETEDKVMAHHELTGSKQLLRLRRAGVTCLWEPFSARYAGIYRCERHLYKNIYGNKLVFEEVNHDLGLTLRLAWRLSDRFGFVKSSWLHNNLEEEAEIELLDGLQNLLPYGVRPDTQQSMSSLLDAYKRSELDQASGLGVFALSATLSDRPEPSESLQATIAWQAGLPVAHYLLSATQLDAFRAGAALVTETDVCGRAGAYFVTSQFNLAPGELRTWHIVADVNQDAASVVELSRWLQQDASVISAELEADIEANTRELARLVAVADGWQKSASLTSSTHHYANVLFNIMRGGVLATGYQVDRADLLAFVRTRNRRLQAEQAAWFAALPDVINIDDLYARATQTGSVELIRLCYEYLPLSFSRRHGDPSRPWNQFSINLKNADGSPRLDYQGNWRDIFQNWEPLLLAFPAYIPGIIAKFLNATTADGYNPYRVTRAGIEWEVPEPDNPWSNIGYWSDHQIIYLQKLLEIAEQQDPAMLRSLYTQPVFSYANVPYRLKSYEAMLDNWSQTIDFDWPAEQAIQARVTALGTDGRLLPDEAGQIIHVTMTEKLLTLLLAKLANLVPEGGIWMNTQRPEWNDANNALVGKGLSVVTTAYLRRFVLFWGAQLDEAAEDSFVIHESVGRLLSEMEGILSAHRPDLQRGFSGASRRGFMDGMGEAVTAYRQQLYAAGLGGVQTELTLGRLRAFLALTLAYLEQTLRANQRPDGLYHAYNTLVLRPEQADVAHLYLMLEGQVAILSSGLLTPAEAATLLQKMRHSELFRPDQHSYMLYPQRRLPGFLEKNNVPAERLADLALVQKLLAAGDRRLLSRDEQGGYHFNGHFHNVHDVRHQLDQLAEELPYKADVAAERQAIEELFEAVFNHQAFTGRSGTFFAYEGLGSIYWHMVAKLLLAVQEICQQAVREEAAPELVAALAASYYDIRAGIGYQKGPAEYGAFPTDPYSHTPAGGGARQPGMTGQVKEEILTRWGELGVSVQAGIIQFEPMLLETDEYLPVADSFAYLDVQGQSRRIDLPAYSLAFTYCQVPV
ncbi:MAG: hypothetical protein KDE59_14355, partial [Anaerolineales bacterium]|nr:hypothetical protein [Anaerolineales bacterium]